MCNFRVTKHRMNWVWIDREGSVRHPDSDSEIIPKNGPAMTGLAAPKTENHGVGGSIPSLGTTPCVRPEFPM